IPHKEAIGEASFYGPKADFQIKSVTGREETASTNQVDYIMPSRFGLKYIGEDGKEHPVVVIHRAPLGSHERFIGFLIEHFAGAFPVWLSPVQAMVLPISDKHQKYSLKVAVDLKKNGVRAEVDGRPESVGKKIREASIQKIPYMLIIGDKEVKAKKVAVRQRDEKDLGALTLKKFTEKILNEINEKTL
ncbi:MAG TPA: threonine--tRNA ligase, partial [Candidatus Paceibacterota bacterium]